MAKEVIWAPKAQRDLFECLDYILADRPPNAERVRNRILNRVKALADMPTGHPGRVFGTFESYVPKTPMILCYELRDRQTAHVLRVIHAKRNWPEGEWPMDD